MRGGTNGGVLARRYEAYRKLVRRFYGEVFGRLRRQVVLVDLLTALQRGQELFADLALATRTVVEAFEELRHPLAKVLPVGRLDRLSLVATKADHITSGQLNNLVGLLRDMLGEPFMRANARQRPACSGSHRCGRPRRRRGCGRARRCNSCAAFPTGGPTWSK